MFDDDLRKRIEASPVVAVLVIDNAADAVPLAEVLLESGIAAMELTLRTAGAIDALKAIRQHVPDIIAGVGTVLTREQVRVVRDSGAAFGVSPGLNPNVLDEARSLGFSFAPGVMTPSDIELALELGCRTMKFFPAEPSGGLKYLHSAAAPYTHLGIQFMPLGGLNAANMKSYLEDPLVLAIGGSWIAPRALIQACDWNAIRRRAEEAVAIVQQINQSKQT